MKQHILSLLASIAVLMSQSSNTSIHAFAVPRASVKAHNNVNNNVNTSILSYCKKTLTTLSSSTPPSPTTTTTSLYGYTPPEQSLTNQSSIKKAPGPKVGDVVRYYELDGGRPDGQELVGKITFIQSSSKNNWIAEITSLEDVGDGYYAEYPWRQKRKSKLYDLKDVAPLAASYVRTEDAFKVPRDAMGRPKPNWESYDLENYQGPGAIPINEEIVSTDFQKYNLLKVELLKNAAIAGLIGTIAANLFMGLEDALIYFAGAIAGVGYLFFLSIKTDTLGSPDAKVGSNVANLRFAFPLLVLVGVAIQNLSAGDASPITAGNRGGLNILRSVSQDQFAAAMLGFLTYRIPLFISQLGPLIGESAGMVLPGSAGMALQMVSDAKNAKDAGSGNTGVFGENLTTILLISGPAGTGKSELVQRLIEDSDGKLVPPRTLDIVSDPMIYEQLEAKNEILQVDNKGRYALTKDGILSAARKPKDGDGLDQVVVVDADVDLSKKLVSMSGIRLVGVWIGLDELDKFESNLRAQLDSGTIEVPEDETKDSVLRGKIREIVKDIEYGVVSGIFEFTVLNDDFDRSLLQLKDAVEYCFK